MDINYTKKINVYFGILAIIALFPLAYITLLADMKIFFILSIVAIAISLILAMTFRNDLSKQKIIKNFMILSLFLVDLSFIYYGNYPNLLTSLALALLIGLYFDKNIILAFGIFSLVAYGVRLGIYPIHEDIKMTVYVREVSFFVLSMFFLYFMTKNGRKAKLETKDKKNKTGEIIQIQNSAIDEIKNSTKGISRDISNVSLTVVGLSNVSAQIEEGTKQLIDGIETQCDSILKTSGIIQNTSEIVGEVTHSFKDLNDKTKTMKDVVKDSNISLKSMQTQIKQINDSSEDSNTMVEELGQDIQRVTSTLSSIFDIASQSNLLALNASIDIAVVM